MVRALLSGLSPVSVMTPRFMARACSMAATTLGELPELLMAVRMSPGSAKRISGKEKHWA